jgi:hypothetical protein
MTQTQTRTRRPNTYAGSCRNCGEQVGAGAGYLGAKVMGRWTVEHGECPAENDIFSMVAESSYRPTASTRARRSTAGYRCDECDELHSDRDGTRCIATGLRH